MLVRGWRISDRIDGARHHRVRHDPVVRRRWHGDLDQVRQLTTPPALPLSRRRLGRRQRQRSGQRWVRERVLRQRRDRLRDRPGRLLDPVIAVTSDDHVAADLGLDTVAPVAADLGLDTFAPVAAVLGLAPVAAVVPTSGSLPSLPSSGSTPSLPSLPSSGSLPSLPSSGSTPSLPSLPSSGSLPSLPSSGSLPSLPKLPIVSSSVTGSGSASSPLLP